MFNGDNGNGNRISIWTWIYRGALLLFIAWAIDEYRTRGDTLDQLSEDVHGLSSGFEQYRSIFADQHIRTDERLRYLERGKRYQATPE